ncbi:UNVERIFIED_CONTAM: hypothetical protein K2H54_033337 [Gekko kuhli]
MQILQSVNFADEERVYLISVYFLNALWKGEGEGVEHFSLICWPLSGVLVCKILPSIAHMFGDIFCQQGLKSDGWCGITKRILRELSSDVSFCVFTSESEFP